MLVVIANEVVVTAHPVSSSQASSPEPDSPTPDIQQVSV